MDYVKLGSSDLKVSALTMGTAFRGGQYKDWPGVIQRALDLGVNTFDTGGYTRNGVNSEDVLGEAIKNKRQDVILAVKHTPQGPTTRSAIENRLKSMKTDYIDVLQILPCRCARVPEDNQGYYPAGPPDFEHSSITKSMEDTEKLVRDGLIRYIGVSRFTPPMLEEANAALTSTKIISDQLQFNLFNRSIENETLPYCKNNNISILAYSPLAVGLLSGNKEVIQRQLGAKYEWFQPDKIDNSLRVVEILREIAADRGKTTAQVALNWVMSKGIVLPISGPDTIAHIEENCGSTGWKLTVEELSRINDALPPTISE